MLKMSMLDDGFTQPILVHGKTHMIIDGEHRWRAACQLGYKEVPVVFVDMTTEQMKISTLRHNRARGSEDIELTLDLLRDIRELGGLDKAVEGLLIDDTELQALLDGTPTPEIMAKENFSQAWVPQENADQPEHVASDRRVSMSDASIDKIKEYEKYIDEAETEDDRELRRMNLSNQILKITATWSIKDAKNIRKALGDRPANRLVQLCAYFVLHHEQDFDEPVLDIARRTWMKRQQK
jgi:ParB-like chromosome segregation protein Spo0J